MTKLRPQSKAGGLRHRVTFQEPVNGFDSWGGPITTWVDYKTLWAEVIYMSGNEYWAARQANSEVQGRVRIRYRDDIKPTMRMVYDGKAMDILAPMTYDSRKTEMHIMFKEQLNDG